MIDAHAALVHAQARLVERAEILRARVDVGDESAWADYTETVQTLVLVAEQLGHESAGRAMTSAELGSRFGLSARTAAKKAKAGQLPVTPIRLGQRGRAALRWRVQA